MVKSIHSYRLESKKIFTEYDNKSFENKFFKKIQC
jgi:hypothetical protein